jgi:lipopolysaccharide export system permease protein
VPPVLRFSWPVLLVIAVSALWLLPWTQEQTQELRSRYQQRSDLDRVAPGQFQESSDGSRVFFINRDSERKSGNDIFITTRDRDVRSVVTAQSGSIEQLPDGQVLKLEKGQRLEFHDPGSDKAVTLRVSQFDVYGARISGAKPLNKDANSFKLLPTWALMQSPSRPNLGELAWRVGLTLSGINLVLLAIAMAHANPRAGRSGRLILAIFTFLVYSNLMTLSQNWVSSAVMGFGPMMLTLHGGFFAIALLWLTSRHRAWSLAVLSRQWFGRLRPGAGA